MRAVAILIVLLIVTGPNRADAGQIDQLKSSRGHHVAVIDDDRREWQGRLLEVSNAELIIELDSAARAFPLTRVTRVDADGDGVIDGAIKGALVGGLLSILFTGEARSFIGGALSWGLLGTGIDALNRCRHTVYRSPAVSASVKVASW